MLYLSEYDRYWIIAEGFMPAIYGKAGFDDAQNNWLEWSQKGYDPYLLGESNGRLTEIPMLEVVVTIS